MRGLEGALRTSVRDELDAAGFVPAASKLYRPPPGLVPRAALVDRVLDSGADVVVVTAPAGYGKSTFVAELTTADPRPMAWLSLTPAEDDPAALLTYVAVALDSVEPVDPDCVAALWSATPTIGSPGLQRFGAMLAARQQPFTLVLDDVHHLTGRNVLDILPVLVSELPVGSTLVLAGRTATPLALGRLRLRRRLVEVGAAQLAFDAAEAASLFVRLGLDVAPAETARLVERTEGWPVAVYLAALARETRPGAGTAAVASFSGDHRFLAEYFAEEVLGNLDDSLVQFLLEASCLEWMSGAVCDEVLQRHDSGQVLAGLQQRTLLVIPLDDRGESYRFHHLMSEFLSTELRRRDPGRAAVVHRRAGDWCDAHGDADGAVVHAVLAGDVDHAEAMVLRWYGTASTTSTRYPTTERWLAMFPPHHLATRPLLMVVAAWARYFAGEAGSALQWLARAQAALPERYPDDVHGLVAPVALALARAFIAPVTPAEMAAETAYVYDHVGLEDGHPMACLGRGLAAFMLGDEAEARRRLHEGADTTLRRPVPVANCLAQLALIDIEHGRWEQAAAATRRATALLDGLGLYPSTVVVLAVEALLETYHGRGDAVEADRLSCRQQLTGLGGIAPWLNLQARIALAHAAVLAGDRVEAAALLDEVEAILEDTCGAPGVERQLAALRREVTTRDRSQRFGPSSLTTAELRVLQLLPTHLSVAEIADRLYVSRNTVKSQTIAIYRKLGTSSRGGAVEAALGAGLLDPAVRRA